MVTTKGDKHLVEEKLPNGDTRVRVLTQRQQLDKVLSQLLEGDDDGDDETTDPEAA